MPYFDYEDGRIHYEEHGKGDPLLLMHGFTQSARDLGPLIEALAPHYHIIAPDFRGSGRSEPRPRTYTPRFYHEDAEDMAALLNHLNTGPTHILGFSDGGEVSLIMGIEHPELARAAVLWGAAGTLGNGDLAPDLDNIYNVVDNPIKDQRGWSNWLKKAYGEEAARGMTQSWATASKAILASGGDISLSRVHEIRCPVLVLAG